MILHVNGSYEIGDWLTRETYPNSHFIDENTSEGAALAAKILKLSPYFTLDIIDGRLVNVTQRDKTPEEIDAENAPAPKTTEQLRIEELEGQNASLLTRLGDVEIALIELFGGGV